MRIGYFADGPWAHRAIELLVKKYHIAFIVPRFDTQDPVLKKWSKELGVPFIPFHNVNKDEFLEKISSLDANLFVSMSFNQILKDKIINFPHLGFINCHAGALPFYRGRNPLNWALINGEERFGITVHYVDEGIDTGDIINQEFYSIEDSDDYSTLLSKAIYECANVLIDAIELIETNAVKRIKQTDIHPVGFYCGRRKTGDEVTSFGWNAKRFCDFVKGITYPGPGARCIKEGNEEIAILKCKLIKDAPKYISTEGEVVGRNKEGAVVKVCDSTVLITQVADVVDGDLINFRIPAFKIGTRLSGRL
jgi:methionyl-tRNA formyltransferase